MGLDISYENYYFLDANRLARFGGHSGSADYAGAFYLLVSYYSTDANSIIGGRLIMFGD